VLIASLALFLVGVAIATVARTRSDPPVVPIPIIAAVAIALIALSVTIGEGTRLAGATLAGLAAGHCVSARSRPEWGWLAAGATGVVMWAVGS
jgi:hypothetical protein